MYSLSIIPYDPLDVCVSVRGGHKIFITGHFGNRQHKLQDIYV